MFVPQPEKTAPKAFLKVKSTHKPSATRDSVLSFYLARGPFFAFRIYELVESTLVAESACFACFAHVLFLERQSSNPPPLVYCQEGPVRRRSCGCCGRRRRGVCFPDICSSNTLYNSASQPLLPLCHPTHSPLFSFLSCVLRKGGSGIVHVFLTRQFFSFSLFTMVS